MFSYNKMYVQSQETFLNKEGFLALNIHLADKGYHDIYTNKSALLPSYLQPIFKEIQIIYIIFSKSSDI